MTACGRIGRPDPSVALPSAILGTIGRPDQRVETHKPRRYMSRKSEERSLDYDPRPPNCGGKGRNARVSAQDDNVNVKRGQEKGSRRDASATKARIESTGKPIGFTFLRLARDRQAKPVLQRRGTTRRGNPPAALPSAALME
jgi:hypothetical protein